MHNGRTRRREATQNLEEATQDVEEAQPVKKKTFGIQFNMNSTVARDHGWPSNVVRRGNHDCDTNSFHDMPFFPMDNGSVIPHRLKTSDQLLGRAQLLRMGKAKLETRRQSIQPKNGWSQRRNEGKRQDPLSDLESCMALRKTHFQTWTYKPTIKPSPHYFWGRFKFRRPNARGKASLSINVKFERATQRRRTDKALHSL